MAEELIWVKGGSKLRDGQVAVAETDDAHPPDPVTGERTAYVVKGDPKTEPGRVGLTALVAQKLRYKELEETKAPSKPAAAPAPAPEPAPAASTETGNGGGEPETDPKKMRRPELEAYAAEQGIENPQAFPNMEKLLEAVLAKADATQNATPGAEGGTGGT